jgi:hypothetical protein
MGIDMELDKLGIWTADTEVGTIYYTGSEKNPGTFTVVTKNRYKGVAPNGNYANSEGRLRLNLWATEEIILDFSESQLVDILVKLATDEINGLIEDGQVITQPEEITENERQQA